MRNVIFTICAKNYLAQALTLRESCIKHNPNTDFYLFISDLNDSNEVPNFVIDLNENWIPNWRQMAFKYNVVEFSTSIKPFCYKELLKKGYEKVIYLDPDIYVTNNLETIYEMLNNKAIVLTPHYCNIQNNYTGAVPEELLLWVGIYNLGFCAIKNNSTGNNIIEWWCNRLEHKCYADKKDGLHVDQKWMDFIPAFFPNDIFITHHMGINPAIWNLHERKLEIDSQGKFLIKNISTNEIFPLLFFHFSGFDPFNASILNRRHPEYGIKEFPTFKPLIDEYVEAEYRNGYNKYSSLPYSFNSFETGEIILPLHRRIYRAKESDLKDSNPFDEKSKIYNLLKINKLLINIKGNGLKQHQSVNKEKKHIYIKLIIKLLSIIKSIFGIKYYASLLYNLDDIIRYEKQIFLLKKDNK